MYSGQHNPSVQKRTVILQRDGFGGGILRLPPIADRAERRPPAGFGFRSGHKRTQALGPRPKILRLKPVRDPPPPPLRATVLPVQPRIAPLPDWDEKGRVDQPVISGC
jgi:hypothetical protein